MKNKQEIQAEYIVLFDDFFSASSLIGQQLLCIGLLQVISTQTTQSLVTEQLVTLQIIK